MVLRLSIEKKAIELVEYQIIYSEFPDLPPRKTRLFSVKLSLNRMAGNRYFKLSKTPVCWGNDILS